MNQINANKFKKRKKSNKRNNTEEQAEYASENEDENEKYCAVSATVVTAQGVFDINDNHVFIPLKIV